MSLNILSPQVVALGMLPIHEIVPLSSNYWTKLWLNISDELAKLLQHPRDLVWIEGATFYFKTSVKNFAKFTRMHVCQSLFFQWSHRPRRFIKRDSDMGISPGILRDFEQHLETTTSGSTI